MTPLMRGGRKRLPSSQLRQLSTAEVLPSWEVVVRLSDLLTDTNVMGHRVLELLKLGAAEDAEVQLRLLLAEVATDEQPHVGAASVAARQAAFRGERP